jgi:hypothetical protein
MAHNLVYFDSSTNSIQKFSNAQLDDLAERVLRVMASGTYTGTITIGTTNPIGTFTDTALVGAAGSTNTTQVSNTYTLTQVSSATLGASSDPPMYVGLDTSTPNQTVLQENLTTIEQLADEILSRMVASTGGTNAYYLASSAPSDGATWVSRGTLLDTITNLTITVTDYKLWQRTTSGATLTNRNPVKLSSGNIQSFSTAEIEALIKTIEQRIVATGIGTYVLQASAPGTGTWSNAGTIIDTREDITTTNFAGGVTYTNENALSYTGTYTGIPGSTNPDAISYTATFLNDSFIGAANFLGEVGFTNPAVGFAGETTFTGNYQVAYTGGFLATYLGAGSFDGTFSIPGVAYEGGPYPIPQPQGGGSSPPRFYTGPGSYTGTYVGNNAIPYDAVTYSRAFVGAIYAGDYAGPATFFAPVTYTGTVAYTGLAAYIGPTVSFDGSSYLGPQTFTGVATNYDGAVYLGTADYLGTVDYEGTRVAPTTSTISTRTLWRRIA